MKKIIILLILTLIVSFYGCSPYVNDDETIENTITQPELNASQPQGEKYGTFTGLKPLDEVHFSVNDPLNERKLPTQKIEHSFGVAKNSEPNEISVNSQKFFDSKDYNAVTLDTSGEKNLYLTFDCGYENGYTNKILDVLKSKNIHAAFFCTLSNIKDEPELIARMITEGHVVGNHSSTHPSFAGIDRTQMAEEIEKCDNYLRTNFGYTAPFFRFPKGEYSENALELVNSLGYKCVFWSLAYNDWNTEAQKGGDYAFATVTARLHPGAVILLHSVSADNAAALERIIDCAQQNGYVFKELTQL